MTTSVVGFGRAAQHAPGERHAGRREDVGRAVHFARAVRGTGNRQHGHRAGDAQQQHRDRSLRVTHRMLPAAVSGSTVTAPSAKRTATFAPSARRAGPGVVAHDLQRFAGAAQQVFDLLAEERPRGHGRLQRAVGAIGRCDRDRLRAHDEPHRIARLQAPRAPCARRSPSPAPPPSPMSPATSVTRPATRFTRPTNCATNCDAGRW